MLADFCGTTALPDNGVIDRLAGFFFPDNSGFTLVRNTDSCNLIGTDIAAFASTSTSVELWVAQFPLGRVLPNLVLSRFAQIRAATR